MPRAPVPSLLPRTVKQPCPLPPGTRLPRPRVWRPVVRTLIVLCAIAIVGFGVKVAFDAF
ncbi:MAG TPA: hypothetical protein VNZ52_05370 [Candidatus Thermoplasmatota archaeon]|nr:hypothetical protein [Candidatus Thermoplasmatota archaeon]